MTELPGIFYSELKLNGNPPKTNCCQNTRSGTSRTQSRLSLVSEVPGFLVLVLLLESLVSLTQFLTFGLSDFHWTSKFFL